MSVTVETAPVDPPITKISAGTNDNNQVVFRRVVPYWSSESEVLEVRTEYYPASPSFGRGGPLAHLSAADARELAAALAAWADGVDSQGA